MAGVERFEELIAWQKARVLTRNIYRASREGAFAKDFGLSGQIQRAAVSAMTNIAEGFDRRGEADFGHFLRIAKASCAEVRSLLYVALDVEYIDQDQFDHLRGQADEAARVIHGLSRSVARHKAENIKQPSRPKHDND